MGLFDKLFGGNKNSSTPKASTTSCVGRLDYNPSGRSEYGFYANCYAKYENGTISNCCNMPSVSPIIIGYYEKDATGNYIVWNMDRDEKVGIIDTATGEITLSLLDSYARIQGIRPYIAKPAALTWKCARAAKGTIFDLTNGMTIGAYSGDTIGAAAAFVCLSYEYVQDGKFHNYFYDWLK